MLRIGKKSKKDAMYVVKSAVDYFGPKGLGLEAERNGSDEVKFTGAGGHVLVRVTPLQSGSDIDIQTQEFDHDAKQFLYKI